MIWLIWTMLKWLTLRPSKSNKWAPKEVPRISKWYLQLRYSRCLGHSWSVLTRSILRVSGFNWFQLFQQQKQYVIWTIIPNNRGDTLCVYTVGIYIFIYYIAVSCYLYKIWYSNITWKKYTAKQIEWLVRGWDYRGYLYRVCVPFISQGVQVAIRRTLATAGARPSCTSEISQPELIFDCRAVTAASWIAPGNDWAISQDGGKWGLCGLNLMHIPKLILDCGAVTPSSVAPLISDRTAVTTTKWIAPRNNRSISQDCSKCTICGLNFPHTFELILDRRAVTTLTCIASSTDPSFSRAAANVAAWTCWTCLSWLWTWELSPPSLGSPQATDSSAKIAANPPFVPATCRTLLSWSWTAVQQVKATECAFYINPDGSVQPGLLQMHILWP